MSLTRFRLTLRQLINLVILSAVFFALLRTLAGWVILVVCGVAILGFLALGLVWGVLFGLGACVSVPIDRLVGRQPLKDEWCRPIVWCGLDDSSPGRAHGGRKL
jgi:hypothetical protein